MDSSISLEAFAIECRLDYLALLGLVGELLKRGHRRDSLSFLHVQPVACHGETKVLDSDKN